MLGVEQPREGFGRLGCVVVCWTEVLPMVLLVVSVALMKGSSQGCCWMVCHGQDGCAHMV